MIRDCLSGSLDGIPWWPFWLVGLHFGGALRGHNGSREDLSKALPGIA